MSTVDYLRHGLEAGRMLIMKLIDDMKDAPLQMPTANGGNPPLWILGHLAYAESNIIEHIIRGNDNPLLEWKKVFGAQTEPSANPEDYPAWDDVRKQSDEIREATLRFLDGLSDEDLAKPTRNPPPGREAMFGTVGACLVTMSMHTMMHYGQVADARRMAGRAPINA
ncbi:MAG: DinB family protein [Planctomycetaceae bacterium]|nr:DinB family protein [Planctomycetaceae bacterium]